MAETPVVFISYSHQDPQWRDCVTDLLASMRRSAVWNDRALEAGEEWRQQIMDAIGVARAAVLLVSKPFLASAFIRDVELPALLARHIPILAVFVGPTTAATRGSLGALQGVNDPARPLCEADAEEGVRVAARLQEAILKALGMPDAPTIGNLPYGTIGTLFKGREGVLGEMERRLQPDARVLIRPTTLYGAGGIGKTRLAVEYALRHAGEFTALLFVGADSPANLRRNLADLCGPGVLDLPEQETPEEAARVEAVLRWLAGHPGWLLILDNADTPDAAAEVEQLFPRLTGGRTIVTSRLANWSAGTEPLELDVLDPDAAAAFLLERTARRRRTPTDDADARALAHDLDGLALALEQAGAYIDTKRLALPAYRELWARHDRKVREWRDPRLTNYPRSVATTWLTTMAQLSRGALSLLRLLSWLAPDPIPLSLIAEQEQDALAELAGYSLVKLEGDTLRVHRLVQEVTRDRPSARQQARSLRAALERVNGAFVGKPDDVRNWPALEPLQPHGAAVVRAADAQRMGEPTARLMNQLSLLLQAKALYSEAEPLMRRALAIREQSGGPNHPSVAVYLNNLAMLLRGTYRLAEAEPLMRRALAVNEGRCGPDHPNVAIRLSNLAILLYATNRLAEAEPLMRRALAIDEASYGPEHPNVGTGLSNLAMLLRGTNRLAEAEPLMRRALKIDEASYGPDHPMVAIRLNNLADLLYATNRLAGAEPLMRRALAIDETSYGREHPGVAVDLSNLAQLLTATSRLAEAEPLMRRALAIDEASHGPEHPDIAVRLNNLARLLQGTDRLAEAEPLMRRHVVIFAVFRARNGHEHPHWSGACQNYLLLLLDMGLSEAEAARKVAEAEAEGSALGGGSG